MPLAPVTTGAGLQPAPVRSMPLVLLLEARVLVDLSAPEERQQDVCVFPICIGLQVRMFWLSTTMSADLPISIEPVSFSRKLALAPLIVKLSIICSHGHALCSQKTSAGPLTAHSEPPAIPAHHAGSNGVRIGFAGRVTG